MEAGEGASAEVVLELGELVAEFFRSVSFAAGQRPSYDRLRPLFIDEGLLIKNSLDTPDVASVEEFVVSRQGLVDAGELTEFEEIESAEITNVFGRVAHRFSTYQKCGVQGGVAFQAKGMITTQFILTPDGWRMTSMAWDDERPV
jgi:hypothetical protein